MDLENDPVLYSVVYPNFGQPKIRYELWLLNFKLHGFLLSSTNDLGLNCIEFTFYYVEFTCFQGEVDMG